MAKLKVFGGSYLGRYRVIVATKTKVSATKLLGLGPGFCSEIGNAAEVAKAMSEPGVVFIAKNNDPYTTDEFARKES